MLNPLDFLGKTIPKKWDGWIPTRTGGFNPLDPQVSAVKTKDLIYGLAGTWRFNGNTYPRMTVAEHVIGVSRIIETLWGEDLAIAGLCHDACEAYAPDMSRTMRKALRVTLPQGEVVSWDEQDRRINQVICQALNVEPSTIEHSQVKAADILSVSIEKTQIDNLSKTDDWGLPQIPEELSSFRYSFWSPFIAAKRLEERWVELGLPHV